MTIQPHEFVLVPREGLPRSSRFPLGGAGAAEGLLFEDDFSSGDLTKHNDNFRWGASGTIPSQGAGSSVITQITGPNGSPVHTRRFRYIGFNQGGTGDAAHFSETRFHLTESVEEVRTRDGTSNVAHPELWVRYMMLVPENYFHRSGQHFNHKGWVSLWKHRYEGPHGESPTHARFEWWPYSGGVSRATAMLRNVGPHIAPSWRAPSHVLTWEHARAFLASEHGQWVDFVFGFKMRSAKDAQDWFVVVYKDGEKVMEWDHTASPHEWSMWPSTDDPAHRGFDRGYLLGYHNAGYDETTEFYITDFKIGTTAASVGLEV